MIENKYRQLAALKKDKALFFKAGAAECALCPDMGGRIFCELDGFAPHRIDLAAAAAPSDSSFTNYGGCTFWPAPEGGSFGFNYRGDEWYVQPAINSQCFRARKTGLNSARLDKQITLVNRAGASLDASMQRDFRLPDGLPEMLQGRALVAHVAYETKDVFKIRNRVRDSEALIASWTLEQFAASGDTLSFCLVDRPEAAINFDFYDHPGDRIFYFDNGFTYRTDGRRKGQIGIKKAAGARCIGYVDRGRNLLCLRQNLGSRSGKFFNIADNAQPQGPYSAADDYSIFNSDESMQAFELETVGGAQVAGGILKGSELVSSTCFAIFKHAKDLAAFLEEILGSKKTEASSP